ncbi:hypothetical protein ABIC98_001392 [Arthrobacter nitrophenolicus]|uniref:Uncharacterized protein n=1 Tax=Arthrobacter nitrophenolicus TaxID=683150 RepID=A0ACC6TE03_9MICC
MSPHRLETLSETSLHAGKAEVDVDAARPLRVVKGDSVFGKRGRIRVDRALAPAPLLQALEHDIETGRVSENIHIG